MSDDRENMHHGRNGQLERRKRMTRSWREQIRMLRCEKLMDQDDFAAASTIAVLQVLLIQVAAAAGTDFASQLAHKKTLSREEWRQDHAHEEKHSEKTCAHVMLYV